jgi:hypothetical protein
MSHELSAQQVQNPCWQVTLSNGEVWFENTIAGLSSAWQRLRQFLAENPSLKIASFKAITPHGTITTPDNMAGYWRVNRISTIVGATGFNIESNEYGIGYIRPGESTINITWYKQSAGCLDCELDTRPAHGDLGVIYNG